MGVEKVKGEVNLDILETGQKRNTRLFFSPLIIQLTTWCQRKDKAIGILTDVLFMLHINAVTQKKSVNYAAKNAWRVCIIVYQNYIILVCVCVLRGRGWGGGGGGGGGRVSLPFWIFLCIAKQLTFIVIPTVSLTTQGLSENNANHNHTIYLPQPLFSP